ncbi:alpha/beta hydrolase [Vibrio sp. 99-70-13A1]|uniref:alpha/beta fold hydrolase n=1 Tax=Vibrio sp. 99-70-13A1 TaxID=2607601 RepID=UPI0014934DE4|nr:alpha/beta hydrolase [Vibrio sp. 99-70-13A1]NOH97865.1 alpha/beta hydrolase [Vibrio sp. 99-70-13A1]
MIERSYSLANGRFATQEIGTPETTAVTVVFIHGWLDNSSSFSTVMEELSALYSEGHLIAVDLLGHGLSSHKPQAFYPFHDYIDDLHQVLSKISANRLVLVGHSLGALIASCYSAAFPENVSGLVQIEGHGPISEAPDQTVSRLRNGVLSRQRHRRKPSRPLASIEDAIKLRSITNHIKPELIAPIVERGVVKHDGVWQWRYDSNLKCDSLYRMSQEHANAIMASITCPQLIILGSDGFRHLQHNRYNLADSDLKVETISGGHHCHLENPRAVSELIFGVVNKI